MKYIKLRIFKTLKKNNLNVWKTEKSSDNIKTRSNTHQIDLHNKCWFLKILLQIVFFKVKSVYSFHIEKGNLF